MEARTVWLACWDLSEGRILSLSGEKEPSMQRTQEGVVFQEDRMAGERAPWYMSVVGLKHRKELLWLEPREAGRWGQGLVEASLCKRVPAVARSLNLKLTMLEATGESSAGLILPEHWIPSVSSVNHIRNLCLLGCSLQKFSHGGIMMPFPPVDRPPQPALFSTLSQHPASPPNPSKLTQTVSTPS